MKQLVLGIMLGAVAIGATVLGNRPADAQAPPLIVNTLCNILESTCGPPSPPFVFDPPLSGFDDPRLGPGPQTSDPNPILVFVIPPAPGSVIIPAAGGNDMMQNYCQVAYRMNSC